MIEVVSVEVTDLARYRLRIGFSDGRSREIDLTERLRDGGPVFRQLYDDPALFAQAYLDPEAATVVWPTGADLAPEALRSGQYAAATASNR